MKFKIAFYLLGVLITINSFGQKSYSLMGKVDTALNNQYVYLYRIDYSKINPQIRDSLQYLLIDFWASWCVPCIENLPTLKYFYEKNKEKNLKLLSISLDSDESRWKDAINKHHLNWDNVSELKGWGGKVSKDYNVYAIPKTVLINPAGKIAGIDIDLTQKLDYLINNFKK